MDTDGAPRWDIYNAQCPTRMVIDRVADKWALLIVGQLSGGTKRFGALRRAIDGITPKVLTQTLRELERDGLVARRVYPTSPPMVEYSLTPLGYTLTALVEQIRTWAEAHVATILDAQARFDTARDGSQGEAD